MYVKCDLLPSNGVEVSKEEYDYVMNPTEAQRREQFLHGNASASDKKEYLFLSMRHFLKDDGSFEEDIDNPFYKEMTVDEMLTEHLKYIYDNEEKATMILQQRQLAKDHIRSVVDEMLQVEV